MSNTHKFGDCKSNETANNTLNTFTNTVFTEGREAWLKSCPVPCKQNVFDVSVRNYHSNSMSNVNLNPNTFYLFLSYDSFVIEESVESLVYDVGSFFAAGLKFIDYFTD